MYSIIEDIQQDDPSYDPLAQALSKTPFVGLKLWQAACDRVYFDGYYGPVKPSDWAEQDGRKPYTVSGAIRIIKKVLDNVEPYYSYEYCDSENSICDDIDICNGHRDECIADTHDIKRALVPFWREIYGSPYPS